MTIRELISLPEMCNISCIAAENFLDEEISGCGVMEFEESIRWVKKGELILTSGRVFETDSLLQRRTVVELKESGCSALGVKIRGFLKSVPEAMVEEAEKQQLPLLAVPFYYSFAEISKIVYSHSFQQSLTAAQKEEALLAQLGKLFFTYQGLDAILRMLSVETGHTILVTDIQYSIISMYASGEYESIFKKGKETRLEPVWNSSFFTEGGKKSGGSFRYCNFKIDGTPYRFFVQALPDYSGCLCIPVEQGELNPWMRQMADRSGMIIALELARGEHIHKGMSSDAFLDFLREDSEKGESEIIRMCGASGFPYQYKRVCIVFHIKNMESSYLREKMKEVFRQILKKEWGDHFRSYLCTGIGVMAAFLIFKDEVGGRQAEQTARKSAEAFAEKIEDDCIAAGVSRCHKEVIQIREAFAECLEALELKKWDISGKKVFQYQDGMIYHILYRLSRKELKDMYQDRAALLAEYDEKNGTRLMETVKTYYDCHFNMAAAAKQLYIHRNTMRQRLEKAGELLLAEPDLSDCGYSLYLGLCAWEILEGRRDRYDD